MFGSFVSGTQSQRACLADLSATVGTRCRFAS